MTRLLAIGPQGAFDPLTAMLAYLVRLGGSHRMLKKLAARAGWAALLGGLTALSGQLSDGSVSPKTAVLALVAAMLGAAARAMQDSREPWSDEQRAQHNDNGK